MTSSAQTLISCVPKAITSLSTATEKLTCPRQSNVCFFFTPESFAYQKIKPSKGKKLEVIHNLIYPVCSFLTAAFYISIRRGILQDAEWSLNGE